MTRRSAPPAALDVPTTFYSGGLSVFGTGQLPFRMSLCGGSAATIGVAFMDGELPWSRVRPGESGAAPSEEGEPDFNGW